MHAAAVEGCVNFHETPVSWHEAQVLSECLAGRVWHDVHVAVGEGCVNFHEAAIPWHDAHEPSRCFSGTT